MWENRKGDRYSCEMNCPACGFRHLCHATIKDESIPLEQVRADLARRIAADCEIVPCGKRWMSGHNLGVPGALAANPIARLASKIRKESLATNQARTWTKEDIDRYQQNRAPDSD